MKKQEVRDKRQREMYSALKSLRPDLYDRACYIGSLVSIEGGSLKLAADVEASVVSIVLDALKAGASDGQ